MVAPRRSPWRRDPVALYPDHAVGLVEGGDDGVVADVGRGDPVEVDPMADP